METNTPRHCIHGVLWGCCIVCGLNLNEVDDADPCDYCAAKDSEIARLRSLATRWYHADGTYEILPEEEVIRRRIEAAGVLKRAEDVEGMARAMWERRSHLPWSIVPLSEQENVKWYAVGVYDYLLRKDKL